jgi:hypothetical protein
LTRVDVNNKKKISFPVTVTSAMGYCKSATARPTGNNIVFYYRLRGPQ